MKKPAHRVTYSSGGHNSQVDYIMVRRRRIKVVDTKVIVGESIAKQHRMVVSEMVIWTKWRKASKSVKKIKWWKLKDPEMKKIQNRSDRKRRTRWTGGLAMSS